MDKRLVIRQSSRWLHYSRPVSIDMVALLKQSIDTVSQKPTIVSSLQEATPSKPTQRKSSKITKTVRYGSDYLTEKYRGKYKTARDPNEVNQIHSFFNTTEVRLEWTTAKFLDIPGELQRKKEEDKLSKFTDEELLSPADNVESSSLKQYSQSRNVGLPEVVFLGKCNVGKSTLLNSLLTELKVNSVSEFAFSSKIAGFTQTMNCFNIGKRFKLIDTPGYGLRGKPQQGKQVMEYLHRRKELRRVFLLISAQEGFDENDFSVIDFLIETGVPFEVVFTKIDKLKSPKVVEKHIKDSGILDLPTEPQLIFTGSKTNKKSPIRQGMGDLRCSIFEACGLKSGIRPLKLIKS